MRARLCTHAREPTGRARPWSFDATTNLCTAFNPRLARGNYVHMAHTLSSDSQLSTRRASLPTRCRSTRLYRPRFHWPTSSGRKIRRGHVEGGEGGKRRDLSPLPLFYRIIQRDNVSSRVETQASRPNPPPPPSPLFPCPSLFFVVDAYNMV